MEQLAWAGFAQTLLVVFIAGAAGVLAYTVMVFALNIKEAKRLPSLLTGR
jgi:hypothetical protein